MGLFSNTVIDKGIASLFGKKSSNKPEPKKNEATIVKAGAELAEPDARMPQQKKESHAPDLEDEYVRKVAKKQDAKTQDAKKQDAEKQPVAESAEEEIEASKEESDEEMIEEDKSDDDASEESSKIIPETSTEGTVYRQSQQVLDAEHDAEHTIFVKNVPNVVITDRSAFKEFKKLFGPEIKSVRFRSIAVAEMAPRKIAFIKQKLHPARDAVNSYIVYKNKDRVFEVMNTMNGREFKDHHLFVDNASKPRPQVPNRSVFIGNMPFEATEEQLFRHFADCGEIENLRIVRDRKYNLGKGFAYVQFADVSTIQLALLKNEQPFQKRSLRVTRCSAKQQKRKHAAERPFKQKQTDRSREGKPKRLGDVKPGTVLEGERAKAGDTVNLGRKRKPRHDKQSKPKKARR